MTAINERALGLLDQSPFVAARDHGHERFGAGARRMPEAQADIAAARAAPVAPVVCVRGQGEHCILDDGHADLCRRADGTLILRKGDLGPLPCMEQVIGEPLGNGCKACDALTWEVDNGKAIILRGDDLARYRALQSAARDAQKATQAVQTTGAALRDAFQQFCAGVAPTKEP